MAKKKEHSENSESNKAPEAGNPVDEKNETAAAVSESNGNYAAACNAENNAVIENISSLEAELASEKDKYLRLAAEYDNFRKRSLKEREGLYNDIRSDTIVRLLPVYDNLSRALLLETEDKAFYKGVEMTMTQMKSIFEKLGVTSIEAVGKIFDPALHNAVMHVDDDGLGINEVVEEYEKGFMLGDKVIRFSVVKVAN